MHELQCDEKPKRNAPGWVQVSTQKTSSQKSTGKKKEEKNELKQKFTFQFLFTSNYVITTNPLFLPCPLYTALNSSKLSTGSFNQTTAFLLLLGTRILELRVNGPSETTFLTDKKTAMSYGLKSSKLNGNIQSNSLHETPKGKYSNRRNQGEIMSSIFDI